MNEDQFKQHLKDLAHGHHHPEEHDWSDGATAAAPVESAPVKKAARKTITARKKAKAAK